MYFPNTYSLPSGSSVSTMTVQKRCSAPSARPLTLFLKTAPAPQSCSDAVPCSKTTHAVKSCLKRPTSRPLAPAQQLCSVPRFVHFGANLEHVRWFYKTESPKQASRDPVFSHTSLPQDSDSQKSLDAGKARMALTAVRKPTPSFSAFESSPVVLESVSYAAGSLSGTVKVHNLAFEKSVFIRMTRDHWRTAQDVPAAFIRSIVGIDGSRPGVDRFRFVLPIDEDAVSNDTNIAMCVCYRVSNQEFWDNNSGANYLFRLSHIQPAAVSSVSKPAAPAVVSAVADNCAQESLGDSVALRKNATSSFSNASFKPAAVSSQTFLSTQGSVTTADARRYMRYSEARFSTVSSTSTLPGTSLPVFATLPWSSGPYSAYNSNAYVSDLHRSHSPMRSSSPIMRTGSPLASPYAWSSYPTTLLHC
ncbi:hypothetical protein FB645_001650 [Coemansia sp. IMI 203386]|nr:hypothetical protein FB645_001650 [Coemansia sp. IMI 203386]